MNKKITTFAFAVLCMLTAACGKVASPADRAPTDDEDTAVTAVSTDGEDTAVASMNANAKTAYNCLAEYMIDNECIGISMQQTFDEGMLGKAETADGFTLGEDGGSEFEKKLNRTDISGKVTIYTALCEIHGENSFFVQVKDTDTGVIGQYPSPIDAEDADKVVWTEYFVSEPKPSSFDSDELDLAAKVAYNAAMTYLTEEQDETGADFTDIVTNGGFPQAYSAEGFTVAPDAAAEKGDSAIYDDMCYNYENVVVHADISSSGDLSVTVTNTDGSGQGMYPKE